MHRGVHPHQSVTAVPVDLALDCRAGRRERCPGRRNVKDGLALALDGVGNGGLLSVPAKNPDIAGLAAGACVENGAIEHDPFRRAGHDSGAGRAEARIVEEELFRHVHSLRRPGRSIASQSRPIMVTELVISPANAAAMARSAGQTRTRMSSCSSAIPAWPAMPSASVGGASMRPA